MAWTDSLSTSLLNSGNPNKSPPEIYIHADPNNGSENAMECNCGFTGTQEKNFIKTGHNLSSWTSGEMYGALFICPQCGVARISRMALVGAVLNLG